MLSLQVVLGLVATLILFAPKIQSLLALVAALFGGKDKPGHDDGPGPGPDDECDGDIIDMLISIRHALEDSESRDVIDSVLVPAAIRMLSEDGDDA